jgi:hypothetical protein
MHRRACTGPPERTGIFIGVHSFSTDVSALGPPRIRCEFRGEMLIAPFLKVHEELC